jgi:hypothetical protein
MVFTTDINILVHRFRGLCAMRNFDCQCSVSWRNNCEAVPTIRCALRCPIQCHLPTIWLLILTVQKKFHLQNVTAEWIAFLLLVRKIPGSNIGPETSCPHCGISWLPPSLLANAGIPKVRTSPLPYISLPIIVQS